MKKYFKLLTVLFLSMILVKVNALDYYASKSEDIDFSKITFKDENGNNMPQDYSLGIIEFSSTFDENNNLKDTKYSYCLDKNMKYPEGYKSYISKGTPANDDVHAKAIVRFGFMRELMYNETLRNKVKSAVGNKIENGPIVTYTSSYGSSTDLVNAFNAGNEIEVTITKVAYDVEIDLSNSPVTIKFKKSDIMYLGYSVTALNNTYNYNHALWILEHSYPTLTVEDALKEAGSDYNTLLTEMKNLYPNESDENIKKLANDYVFVVVQHSIWKATGATFNNVKLGNTLTGSNELNKLYQWLNEDREIYANYGSLTYENIIDFTKPAAGKEVYSNNNGIIKYGPYTINAKVVSTANITLEVTDSYKDKVKIVDKLGNVIDKFEDGTEFYLSVNAKDKISEINLKATADNALVFEPAENRGKIYYSQYPYFQNIVVGGKVSTTNVVGTIKLEYNPSTGVTNVAALFIITLVSFAIGYLVLNYKNKPVTF